MNGSNSTPASTRLRVGCAAVVLGVVALSGCGSTKSDTNAAANDPVAPAATTAATTVSEAPAATTVETGAATTTTTEAATTTSVSVNPFSDAEIATKVLLDADEYGAGWQLFDFKKIALDATAAAEIPGCATFIDTVFESDARPAVTAGRWFHAPPGRKAAMSQYVVVFPTDAAAEAMFAATVDPAFRSDCFVPYAKATGSPDGFCCDPTVPFPGAFWGEPVESTKTLGSSDIQFRHAGEYWTDAAGTNHGVEQFDEATVRVGRVISVIEAIKVDEFGEPFVTDAEFDQAIATISERAIHALGGVIH